MTASRPMPKNRRWLRRLPLLSPFAVAVAVSGGCVLSGQATVGAWRAGRQIDTVVCIEESPEGCRETVNVGRELPARSFREGGIKLFSPGYTRLSRGQTTQHYVAINSHVEYLRSRGALAVGGRVGAHVSVQRSRTLVSAPASAIGYAIMPRAALYAGVGYAPWAQFNEAISQYERRSTRLHGVHVLVGGHIIIESRVASKTTFGVELTRQDLGELSVTTLTAHLGGAM